MSEIKHENQELLEALKDLLEATVQTDIATTDENLSVDSMYQQSAVDSLARKVCSVSPIHGPTGALFNIRRKDGTNDFELVRKDVEVFPSNPSLTGITNEVIQDVKNMYGKDANQIIGKLFRSISNEDENANLFSILDTNAKLEADLQLTDSSNAEVNLFEVTQRVQELVLKMNQKNFRTYEAFAIIPAGALGGIMALSQYAGGDNRDERGLFIAQINQTKYYLNPDVTSTAAYVGLKDSEDSGKSSLVFSPYQSQIVEAIDPNSGNAVYRIFNRYAITPSPLHVADNEMLYKFNILL